MKRLRNVLGLSIAIAAACLYPPVGAHAQTQPSIKVTVLTKHGHPMRGVALTLAAEDRIRSGTTSGKGEFEFENLPDLLYVLEAFYLDFPIATIQGIRPQNPSSRSLSITLDPPGGYFFRGLGTDTPCMLLDIGSLSYGERQGRVSVVGTVAILGRDMRSMTTDRAVTIDLLSASQLETPVAEAQTNDLGEFHFDDLDPGKYRLRISHKGNYTGTTTEFWVSRGNMTRFGKITMYPEGTTDLCGTVLEIIPFDDPVNSSPDLELIDPN